MNITDLQEFHIRSDNSDNVIQCFGMNYFQKKDKEAQRIEEKAIGYEHPTMKPLKILNQLIVNSTTKGENILDVFGGSGSTLIACELAERTCCMMELDPYYCSIIIERWENLTGQKAQKINLVCN